MSGWERVAQLCSERLDPKHIKERKGGGGVKLKYVEGWHVIDEANRIFGFGAWSRETTLIPLGEPRAANGKWTFLMAAKVRITVDLGDHGSIVFRDGCGFGIGVNANPGDAYEIAVKTAETDATKRALVTFGKPFGLELYDKDYSVSSVEEGEGQGVGSLPPSDTQNLAPVDNWGAPDDAGHTQISAARSKDNWKILMPQIEALPTANKIHKWWKANTEAIESLERRHMWQFFDAMIVHGLKKCQTSNGVETFWKLNEPDLNRYGKFSISDYEGLQEYMTMRFNELKKAEKLKAQAEKAFDLEPGSATLTVLDAG